MGAQANPAVPTKQDLKQSLDKLDMSKDVRRRQCTIYATMAVSPRPELHLHFPLDPETVPCSPERRN